MLIPRSVQENPYRVLRLSVNATISDIHKAAAGMRRVALLGTTGTTDADLPYLGEIHRAEPDIRAAVGRLENPAHRIADRLFWLHNSTVTVASATTNPDADLRVPLKKAASDHDEALQSLFGVLCSEHSQVNIGSWITALRGWHQALSSEEYWKLSSYLDQLGGFEPAASIAEFAALRVNAVSLAAESLLMSARQAAAQGDIGRLTTILNGLTESEDTGDWTIAARQEILAPAVTHVRDACGQNRKDFGSKVSRLHDAAEENIVPCRDVLSHYREHVEPALASLRLLLPNGSEEVELAREEVARCLSQIAQDFTWADEFVVAEDLLNEALRLGEGTVAAVNIQRSLEEISGTAASQRLFIGLTPSADAAVKSLQQVLRAIVSDWRSQIVREQQARDANKVICESMLKQYRQQVPLLLHNVLQLVPHEHPVRSEMRADVALSLNGIATDFTWADDFITALQLREEVGVLAEGTKAAERVKEGVEELREPARQERLLKELTPIKAAPGLGTLNGVGARLYGNSDYDAATQSFATTYYFTFFYFPIIPLRRYRVIQEGKSYRFLGRVPFRKFDRWHLWIVLSVALIMLIYGMASSDPSMSSSQTTPTATSAESTSSSAEAPDNSTERVEIKSQIDAGRVRMEGLKTELNPVVDELGRLKSRISSLDEEIKSLDEQSKAGSTINTADYNSKVNEYNDLLSRRRTLYASHSSDLDTYQDLLKKDDALVAQYNALLR